MVGLIIFDLDCNCFMATKTAKTNYVSGGLGVWKSYAPIDKEDLKTRPKEHVLPAGVGDIELGGVSTSKDKGVDSALGGRVIPKKKKKSLLTGRCPSFLAWSFCCSGCVGIVWGCVLFSIWVFSICDYPEGNVWVDETEVAFSGGFYVSGRVVLHKNEVSMENDCLVDSFTGSDCWNSWSQNFTKVSTPVSVSTGSVVAYWNDNTLRNMQFKCGPTIVTGLFIGIGVFCAGAVLVFLLVLASIYLYRSIGDDKDRADEIASTFIAIVCCPFLCCMGTMEGFHNANRRY